MRIKWNMWTIHTAQCDRLQYNHQPDGGVRLQLGRTRADRLIPTWKRDQWTCIQRSHHAFAKPNSWTELIHRSVGRLSANPSICDGVDHLRPLACKCTLVVALDAPQRWWCAFAGLMQILLGAAAVNVWWQGTCAQICACYHSSSVDVELSCFSDGWYKFVTIYCIWEKFFLLVGCNVSARLSAMYW